MDAAQLTSLFGWMTAINIAILCAATVVMLALRTWGVALHARMFGLSTEKVALVWYDFLGTYKLAIVLFNLTPYLAFRIAF